MNGAFVIAGKDLRSLFMSPLFYILAGICTIAWSFMFFLTVSEFMRQSVFQMAQPGAGGDAEGLSLHFNVIAGHISIVHLLLIFAIAAFTMRLFTEEKKARTYDLLLTAPVTATQITLGKLTAGILSAWALVLVSLIYPLTLRFFGPIEWGPLFSSYIGLMFLVACYVSIGMFASSITESNVLAVIMSLIFSVMLWLIGAAADAADNPVSKKILEHLNVRTHFMNFLKGNVSMAGFVFFLSIIFLFAFLTQRVVESSRWR